MDKTKTIRSNTTEMIIGKTKYIVTSHFNESGRETAEQKLFRYISDRVVSEMKTPEITVK